jgi:nucleoid DNA-binding protein
MIMSNRSKLADLLAAEFNTTKKHGAELLAVFSGALHTHLRAESQAVIPGIGRLKLEKRAARRGYNPRTGESIQISERETVKFKPFPGAFKD